MTELGVRHWAPSDAAAVAPLLLGFLRDTYDTGADFLPSEHNVDIFWRIGLQAAADGDPVLLAENTDEVVAFILWVGQGQTVWEQRDRVCLGMGTYVVPHYRRTGVGRMIRERGHEVARARGYTRIDGVGYYDAPKRLMLSNGWIHSACVYRKEL